MDDYEVRDEGQKFEIRDLSSSAAKDSKLVLERNEGFEIPPEAAG